MNNKITINVVEPGSPTPVDPGTGVDPVVPNTGLFTHGISSPEATAIGAVIVLAIVAIVVAILYKKHKKQGKATKLVHLVDSCKTIVKSKKRVTASLTALALIASTATFIALARNAVNAADNESQNTNEVEMGTETESEDSLNIDVSSPELTIEVGDEPVFAVLPVQVTVEEALEAGYTLTAYTDSTDLVSTTDPNNTIPMIAVEGDELAKLTDNTYGLALTEPKSKDNEIYTTLSTDADNPTLITDKDYEPTEANDTTTIYYGFYITPDVPYGTYEGGNISYDVEENRTDLATIVFDGNGLTFDGSGTNTVRYLPGVETAKTVVYSHTSNVDDSGGQNGIYGRNLDVTNVYQFADNAAKVHVKIIKSGNDTECGDMNRGIDYFSFWPGNHANYTALNDYASAAKAFGNTDGKYVFGGYNNAETDLDGVDAVTISYTTNEYDNTSWCPSSSGYGFYAEVTAQDISGNMVNLMGNESYIGDYLLPNSDAAYMFLGWSTDSEAYTPMYSGEDDIDFALHLDAGDKVILYAVWQPTFSITYNGNGADADTNMDNVEQYTTDIESTEKQVDLLASNFTREGYGFAGWSVDAEAWDHLIDNDESNNPTIYGPNQTITIDKDVIAEAGENRKLVLNAVWVPAETTASGDPVELQSWQGCSNLTATTYDTETGTLSVGKNTITALTDARDGNIYTVARLADGNCWTTENLRLDNSVDYESTTEEFSATNTNNPSLPLTNNYTEQTTSNRLSVSSSDWCSAYDGSPCYDQSIVNTTNIMNVVVSPVFSQDFANAAHKNFSDNIGSYGVYYNWYSATAGNGTYDKSSGEVAGDICPAGWQLPVGRNNNTSGSFYYLSQQMGGNTSSQGSNNWRSFPNNFVYSGSWDGSLEPARGGGGYYWSSTPYAQTIDAALDVAVSYVTPGSRDVSKVGGYSVRCVSPVE